LRSQRPAPLDTVDENGFDSRFEQGDVERGYAGLA
jgi:hypothetical protein